MDGLQTYNRIQYSQEQLKNFIQGPADVEWKYEMRRQCQEILPGLFLGSFVVSKELATLQGLGITHVVCIRDAKEAFTVKPRFPDHFQYMTLDVEDNEEQNLIRLFPGAKGFIDQAIACGGKVLVHCNGGISLSPAFVVMFVMQYYQLNWEDALHLVQNRRYCISPNGGFLTQIKEYEAIYRANIAVAAHPQMGERTTRRKRSDDDEEDENDRAMEDRKRALVDHNPAPEYDPNAMET
ncbi:protein-tyrosine phosphatase-like protein [Schizophyllum amplum]|uniref:Protein-tyrosine phosphatase-like protein n=1 Tax=Schizophyllum amplum TaxID=97359 RepID=A0A550C8D8_9AGAR|nr:protein-tyrosine phosphatase-like protein [Auriculariopsis ampla]